MEAEFHLTLTLEELDRLVGAVEGAGGHMGQDAECPGCRLYLKLMDALPAEVDRAA